MRRMLKRLRRILPFATKQVPRPWKEPPGQPATELAVLFAPPSQQRRRHQLTDRASAAQHGHAGGGLGESVSLDDHQPAVQIGLQQGHGYRRAPAARAADACSGASAGVEAPLLVVGSVASLAANVAVAEPTATGRVIAAWPSFALIASYELSPGVPSLSHHVARTGHATRFWNAPPWVSCSLFLCSLPL